MNQDTGEQRLPRFSVRSDQNRKEPSPAVSRGQADCHLMIGSVEMAVMMKLIACCL